jgi:AraC family transcriptional regulator
MPANLTESLQPESRSIRLARYAANSSMAAHHHELPSLSIVVSGLYEERVRGRICEHGPGNLLFYPAFEPHSQRFCAVDTFKILITPTRSDIEFLSEHLRLEDAPYIQSESLCELGARAVAEMRAADCFSTLVLQGLTLEALGVFCRTARSKPNVLPWLREAKSFIESHFSEAVTLDELARVVRRHPIHLSRAFRQAYGQTIGECIRSARVRNAARLLLASGQPISEVATESGFCDQAHLSRAFKRVFGMTPAAYRFAGR